MSLDEFKLIDTYFKKLSSRPDVELGIGDDAAILKIPPHRNLVVTTDTLNLNSHFFSDTEPSDIGYKAAAVSLSDLAAMGAVPSWALLSLTIPEADPKWLASFAEGLFACLNSFDVALVGGNTSKGPLAVTTQMLGLVAPGKALLRSTATAGDLIYVSGTLGDSALALALLKNELAVSLLPEQKQRLIQKLWRPTPRVQLGQLLCGQASSAIDISDGLVADLQHILEGSEVGATILVEQLPLSVELATISFETQLTLSLITGDDYELCFTIAPSQIHLLQDYSQQSGCPLTCIGQIEARPGLRLQTLDGGQIKLAGQGYQHF